MEKEYPFIEVLSDGRRNWYEGARCMFFVYSRDNGNFILKGYRREVENYLKENYTHYFYYNSMWHKGISRGNWYFWKNNVSIFEPSNNKREKYTVVKHAKSSEFYFGKNEVRLTFKRLPKRWIPEFNKL
jgi:hypothetical protein